MIITGKMLPCAASPTLNCAAVIIVEFTNAFDGPFIGCPRIRVGAVDRRGERSGDRRWIRGGVRGCEGGGICHSLTDNPLSGERVKRVEGGDSNGGPDPFLSTEHVNDHQGRVIIALSYPRC